MRKMAGFGIIAIAIVWGLILMILWSDNFITDTKAEIYNAIIFVMLAIGFYPIIIKSQK
jgi:hypothetical protein